MATTFSWNNYKLQTPKNLEYIAAALRRIVAVVAGTTIIMEANKWIPLAVVIVGAILDELKNFFAYVSEGEHEVVQVSFPAEVADKVDITQKIIPAESIKKPD